MAKGFRKGDPKLKIATCAMIVGKSHRYAKSVECVKGLESLFDVLTVHTYAEAEPWPTWRRSYPEDPSIKYLKDVKALQNWRDANASGKPVWVTEFGWDASTKKPPPTGDFAKWVGNTETQQGYWLVRSTLLFMKMKVERAYVYFFNDDDAPHMHGSSGLTRKFVPKPAFHALAHLQKTLGDFHFHRVVREEPDKTCVYEFANASETMWVAWSAKGGDAVRKIEVPLDDFTVVGAERTPLAAGGSTKVEVAVKGDSVFLPISEAPLFVRLKRKR
jgi:hypothetical protein